MGPHDQGITVSFSEREVAIIGLGLAHAVFSGAIEPTEALALFDRIMAGIPASRRDDLINLLPDDVRARYRERNPDL